jgi:hypothetical protein
MVKLEFCALATKTGNKLTSVSLAKMHSTGFACSELETLSWGTQAGNWTCQM